MDRLKELQAFVAIDELGTLAAAAGSVGITPSAMSKLLARLEQRVGLPLVTRTTRRLSLTPEGKAYLAQSRVILEALEALDRNVIGMKAAPRGVLRVTTGMAFGIHQLCPALPRFTESYPDVRIELSMSDRIVDLVNEHFDIGVRLGHLKDSTLLTRKFAQTRRVICASPEYIERHGRPRKPDDLDRHRTLALSAVAESHRWPFRDAGGRVAYMGINPAIVSDTAEGVLQLGLAGAGILRLGDMTVGNYIEAGQLVPLLERRHYAEPLPMSLVYPPGLQNVPRVRAFMDFVFDEFSG